MYSYSYSSARRSAPLRLAAAVLGAVALAVGGGALAATAAEEQGEGDVDVKVDIAPVEQPGVLAMSIAGTSVTLTESGSTALTRQFVGSLPRVTVADTRTPAEIPEGAYWYVLGTASDFVGSAGQPEITAGHLGWRPSLIDGGASGLVAVGDEVMTVLDEETLPGNDVGLVDEELLAMAADSEEIATEGRWTAEADLFLKTDVAVAPGGYSSVLTLSLFE